MQSNFVLQQTCKAMEFKVISQENWNELLQEISDIKNLLKSNASSIDAQKWVSKAEACKKLRVCAKTLDNYLKKGVLPYTQYASKIYIKSSDIEMHLEKNYIKKAS